MTPYDLTLAIYNLTLFPVIFFSVLLIVLGALNLFIRKESKVKAKVLEKLPFISVQVPTYNDPIAARCIQHCMLFDYPREMYEIIIVDDSTNHATQKLLSGFAEKNQGFVRYIHRDNREGFKAGALKNAMDITKGEIIVIFDSDWMPKKDFLQKIIKPFADDKVALVQTRQGIYNKDVNYITRFAAYSLMVYHTIIMPINNRINCVFFCGTAGAIRRTMFEEVNGWNLNSLTEDSDLTVKLLLKGYKSIYLDIETPSEVPQTFEGFIKQQMRWCYGNVRVFFDNAFDITLKKGLTIRQRLMITYVTLGNIIAPIVVAMTVFGSIGWVIGDPKIIAVSDIITLFSRFAITSGFLVIGLITLYKRDLIKDFPYLVASTMTIGIVLAVVNSIAFLRAAGNRKLHWYCTP